MDAESARRVTLGRITGAFGIKGWVKVESFTRPRENILEYSRWLVSRRGECEEMRLLDGSLSGGAVIASLARVDGTPLGDRDQAAALAGSEVAVLRSEMPEPEPGQYYWSDLIGLRVEHQDGRPLGKVESLLETGAHDVLVVKGERERLVPFVQGRIVQEVDLSKGVIRVDWDPEF